MFKLSINYITSVTLAYAYFLYKMIVLSVTGRFCNVGFCVAVSLTPAGCISNLKGIAYRQSMLNSITFMFCMSYLVP